MKKLVTIIIICIIWALPVKLSAQINEEKMDKDLRVAAKVLETLSQGQSQGQNMIFMYGRGNIEGNYIDGYGVIFSITNTSLYSPRLSYSFGRVGSASTVVVAPKASDKTYLKVKDEGIDYEDLIVEFLADYSQLISQLKPTDKIVVSTKKSSYAFVISDEVEFANPARNSGLAVELLKKDHNDYMSGKISHDQLVAKIKVTRNDGETGRSKDLDMFGSMLSTIYSESYTDSYWISWRPEYERIPGVGAIYAFKVYSSYEEDGLFRMPGINKDKLNDEARSENVIKLYPLFVAGMKESIIQYGRTIKSLEPDELILLKITLTKCDGCNIPKKIQLAVKQSVLTSFNSGKISLKDATAQVKLSEL